MKKTVLVVMILSLLTKTLGFIREIVLSYYYGVSNISDAYLVSLTIPVTIFSLVGTGIVTGYIPVYSKKFNEKNSEKSETFTSNAMNFIILSCLLIIFIVQMSTPQIVKLFASGFEGVTLELTIGFTRIFVFSIVFYSITYLLTGYLQVHNSFAIPSLGSIPLNLIIILTIAISTKYNIHIISIGTLLAAVSQTLFLAAFAYKKGYRHKLILDRHDENLSTMVLLALPVILGSSVNQINVLVDRAIASNLEIGGISALNYANRLNLFVQGIFVLSISTVLFPTISKMAVEKNMCGLKKSVREAISGINLFVMPATVGAMLFATPVISLLFGRGAFDENAILMTSKSLFFYSIGMIGFGLREILSRVFYSLKDTKTPMINATLALIINIILNIILSKFLGIGGLALATSISALFCTLLLFFSLRKKIGSFGMKQMFISFLKILFASIVMGAIAKLSFNYLTTNVFSQNISLLVAIGVGAMSYFIIIYFMKIEDVDVIVRAIKGKLKRSAA